MTIIAYVFKKVATAKDAVTQMSKESHFRTSFDSQDVKESKTLLKTS